MDMYPKQVMQYVGKNKLELYNKLKNTSRMDKNSNQNAGGSRYDASTLFD